MLRNSQSMQRTHPKSKQNHEFQIHCKSLPGSLKTIQCRLVHKVVNIMKQVNYDRNKTSAKPAFPIKLLPCQHDTTAMVIFDIFFEFMVTHPFQAIKTHHYETLQIDFQSIRPICICSSSKFNFNHH